MKKTFSFIVVALCILSSAGCVIFSVFPWLGDKTRVTNDALLGIWFDEQNRETAFFANGKDRTYDLLKVGQNSEEDRITATLHAIDQVTLLMVGPQDPDDSPFATLPVYLLFKIEILGDTLNLYEIDLEAFGEKLESAQIKVADNGSKENGFILFSSTATLETFVRSQLKDPAFFRAKPLYSFKRVSRK